MDYLKLQLVADSRKLHAADTAETSHGTFFQHLWLTLNLMIYVFFL